MKAALAGFLFVGLAAVAPAGHAMELLSSEELQAVDGRDGVSFEWDLRINADEDGTPLSFCTGANRTACRIALEYENRDGEWVVFKGFSGRFYWSRFNLDAFTAPASTSGYGDMTRFTVEPYGKPHLEVTFVDPLEIYNFRMSKVSIEYDLNGSPAPGQFGYEQDPTDLNTFLGLAISNSVANQPGTMTFEGRMTIWGF